MDIKIYADRLRKATEESTAIPPLSTEIGTTDLGLAYQIQNYNNQIRLDKGEKLVGRKIGLTSFKVQEQFGINQPDFGMLFSDMEVLTGQSLSVKETMQPKVEAEIAFVLSEDLDFDNITIVDLISCIDYALPAIEIVGSRIENWNIKITDTIADNASASHFVVGHTPKTLDEFDVISCAMGMNVNHEVKSTGSGAACMGSPLNALIWLANKMIEMGNPLQAGELILSGALGPMVPVKAGDHVSAEFGGLGSVSIDFSE